MDVIKTDCGLCINCCGLTAYVDDGKVVKVEGIEDHWLTKGALCPKGLRVPEYIYSANRVKTPLKKVDGKFVSVSWDQALQEIGDKLLELKDKYGAKNLCTYTGSVGVEHFEMAAFNQRFRGAYGTPNFFNAEGNCFRSRILARQITFGRYPIEEPKNSDCIILWGRNPDTSYFPMGQIIRDAVEAGASLITIDPRRIPISKLGLYMQPRCGTDAAIAQAMIHVIIKENLYDKEFVDNYCEGFDKLAESVATCTPEWAAKVSGVGAAEIRLISRMFANAKAGCIVEGVGGMNQGTNGLQNHRIFSILQSLIGGIDRPGGWVTIPMVRLADMRLPDKIEGNALGFDEFPVFHQFGKNPPPYGSSSLMSEAMITGNPYPLKSFIVSGGNPAVTFADTKRFVKGCENLELMVVIDPMMTETANMADYVLPACTCFEETGIGGFPYGISYCEPFIMLRKKLVEPLYESKSIWWIWSELGRKMGYGEYFPWNSDEEVAEHFFSTSGLTMQQLIDNPDGLYFGKKEYGFFEKKGFFTASKKVELYSARMAELGADPVPIHVEPEQSHVSNPEIAKEFPEILNTGARTIEYIDAQMRDTSLRAIRPEPEVEVNTNTAAKYGIEDGEMCGIETPRGSIKMRAKVSHDIVPGAVFVPHGWADANCNVLLDSELLDPVSGYITMRGVACRLVKLVS